MRLNRAVARFSAALVLAGTAVCGAATGEVEIEVLSNRADLVSGGDALVEVILPAGTDLSELRVDVDGRDVTSAIRPRPNGRVIGLVSGLREGSNVLTARLADGRGAHITITNHPVGGPIFSGAQLQPWICARPTATPVLVSVPGTSLSATVTSRASGLPDGPLDEKCNATSRFDFFYQPKSLQGSTCTFSNSGANACFQPYDANNPPPEADIADFTNDRGDTVKSIIVVERGTMDRGIYQLVTFFDPAKAHSPWAPQRGWNGKLLWRFGASSSVSRFQTPPGVSVFLDRALRRGYMVASSSLTDHGTNANDTFGAEIMMMVKERIAETYGPIRYTLGDGCSGGSIMQQSIAGAYPGLLDGIQPTCSYPDTTTTVIEVIDCGVLQSNYYTTADGTALGPVKQAAINGHPVTGFCNAWVGSYLNNQNPSQASNCGSGWPAALTYSKTSNPPRGDGVRCDLADHDVGMVGSFVDVDGHVKANPARDNVGLQYGLTALQGSVISAEEFVRLNEGVGGFTADLTWTGPSPGPGTPAPREKARPEALRTYYSGGLVSDGRQLAKLPIIDLRGNESRSGDIHMNWRAWAVRDRLDRDFGDHGNHLIWAYNSTGGASAAGAALAERSFATLDAWVANIEQDTTDRPIEEKVRANKPSGAADLCLLDTGASEPLIDVGLGSPACPVKYGTPNSPRQAAGGPLAENIFKCTLKPLDRADYGFMPVAFTDAQWARLQAVFPDGVCDWSVPGVGQVPENPYTTYADGPGGRPLGDAPVSEPFGPTQAPTGTLTLSPKLLWPPNHKLVPITQTLTVSEGATVSAPVVTSNEPQVGCDVGDVGPDWVVSGASIQLRAERCVAGTGRVYTVTYTLTNSAGKSSQVSATVSVPRSQ